LGETERLWLLSVVTLNFFFCFAVTFAIFIRFLAFSLPQFVPEALITPAVLRVPKVPFDFSEAFITLW
jgi:hypothetical protein